MDTNYIKKLEIALLKDLKAIGIELSPTAKLNINGNRIEIGVLCTDNESTRYGQTEFGSTFDIIFRKNDEFKLSLPSTMAFDNTNEASYWRTIQAASVLKNWSKVTEIVNKYLSDLNDYYEKK